MIDRHLELRARGDIELDITENYHPDVVLFTHSALYTGHPGVRQSAADLAFYLGDKADFEIGTYQVDGPNAFLEWVGYTDERFVFDGSESFRVEQGKIVLQSIHYSVDRGGPTHFPHQGHRGFTRA